MRIKIIAVNALIVAIVGLLSFWLMKASLGSAAGSTEQLAAEAQRDAQGAAARLQLDGLRAERWLAGKAGESQTLDPLVKATAAARGEAATNRCNDLVSQMKNATLFEGNVPTLVAMVDAGGKIVGRNNSNLNRGDDLAGTYSGLKATLAGGQSGSDVWYERDAGYLASYVAVHDDKGAIVGALVIGRPLNDTLTKVSEATTGRPLVIVAAKGDTWSIVANSAQQSPTLKDSIGKAGDMLKNVLSQKKSSFMEDAGQLVAASPLPAFEDGKRALLVATAPATLIQDPSSTSMPILGAMALGIVLVIIGGWLLGNYITRPINMLEEGLLAILNGQTDKRFELDHAELGGLGFRIDQLLNQLMGVEEDTTDAEGRVSMAPNAANFTDALAVDDKRMAGEGTLDPDAAARLAGEPEPQYLGRIYREYIAAKRALGEATDHITEQAFAARIQGMERDAAAKYGRPVRYMVQARQKEVVLLAVPLP